MQYDNIEYGRGYAKTNSLMEMRILSFLSNQVTIIFLMLMRWVVI